MPTREPGPHLRVTNSPVEHGHPALSCMVAEFDAFLASGLCHEDGDHYVNARALLKLLKAFHGPVMSTEAGPA